MPSNRLATSANDSAISIDASPTTATIHGLQAPAVAASAAGRANTAPPITWLTPTAVRSHRPSTRFKPSQELVSATGCTGWLYHFSIGAGHNRSGLNLAGLQPDD